MSWRKVSYIRSTNNENYVWRELDYFSSPANVCRFLKKRYPNLNPGISEVKGIEISSCITQAGQYWNSAKLTGYATRPLLLFYCTENLTSALLMILRQNLTLRHFRESHGVNIIKHRLQEHQTDLSKILITIEKSGLFAQLFKTDLSDWALPRHTNSGKSKWAAGFRLENERVNFLRRSVSLMDLLSLIPEVDEIYTRIFGSHPSILSGGLTYHWKDDNAERIDLFLDRTTKQLTEELLIEKLPLLKEGYDKEETSAYFKFTCSPEAEALLLCEDIYGDIYIKGSIPVHLCKSGRIELSRDRLFLIDLEVHFLIMYALSMLCRYELRLWDNLMIKRDQGLDHLVKRFLEISSYKFPFLIWREIFDTHFILRAPGTVYKRYR